MLLSLIQRPHLGTMLDVEDTVVNKNKVNMIMETTVGGGK